MAKKKISEMTAGELKAHQEKQAKAFKEEYGYTRDDETKRQRFNRVYGARLKKVIKAIDGLGACSGSTYEYDMKVIETASTYLHNKVDNVKDQFTPKAEKTDDTANTVKDIMTGAITTEEEDQPLEE